MKKFGFTLIELIIVVIIIGILAVIAAPIMGGMEMKAIKTEAITALGTIRTAEELYYTTYKKYVDSSFWNADDSLNNLKEFILCSDLDGQYFSSRCYAVALQAGGFIIQCNPKMSIAPNKDKVTGLTVLIQMNQDGIVTEPTNSGPGP